jgi:uncharacterized protein YraI
MPATRSAAVRAGLSGTVGAALLLATLAPTISSASPDGAGADVGGGPSTVELVAASLPVPTTVRPEDVAAAELARDRQQASRSQQRAALVAAQQTAQAGPVRPVADVDQPPPSPEPAPAPPAVVGERYTTTALNVRSTPGGSVVTVLERGATVSITDRTDGAWQQVRYDGQDLWVSGEYLSSEKPAPPAAPAAPAASGTTSAPSSGTCSQGSGIESGLTANARAVYRAVCGRWPQISGYGGYRPDGGSHGSGRAVDIMVSGSLGWEVANYVRANAGALGVSEVIYAQQIWTVQRSGEGWRPMSDRGSTTANHYDHVHVTVY